MGKLKGGIFRLLCAILLVFTTIAPSLAVANSEPIEYSIIVHPGSDSRTINWAEGRMISDYETTYFNSVSLDNGSVLLTGKAYTVSSDPYRKVLISLDYIDNGEHYHLIEEIAVSDETAEFTIPAHDILYESNILPDIEAFSDINVQMFYYNDQKTQSSSLYLDNNVRLVSSGPFTAPLSIQGKLDGKKYLLKSQLILGQDVTLSSLLGDSSELTIEGDYESLLFYQSETQTHFNLFKDEQETVVIANGTYEVSSYINGIRWTSTFDVNGNNTIILPTEPDSLDFENVNHHAYDTTVNLNYNLQMKSGDFQADSYNSSSPVSFVLRNDEGVVTEWESSYLHGDKELDAIKSGSYILEAALQLNGKTLTASKELHINSALNTLKGTVITAENATGSPLESGKVVLYEIRSYSGYKQVQPVKTAEVQLDNGIYETFIPDAYVLDGKEYLLTLVNDKEKIAYTKKFIGQSDKNIHFSAEDLKPIGVNAGVLETVNTKINLGESDENYYSRLIELDGNEWSISSDLQIQMTWIGKDANNNGYIWSDIVDENLGNVDLTNEEWQSLKPLSSYPNATLGFISEKEQYNELRLGGSEKEAARTVRLVVYDEEFFYSSNVLVWSGSTEEVQFTPSIGTASFDEKNNIFYIQYMNQAHQQMVINSGQNGEVLKLVYGIFDESNEQVGESINTDQLNSLPLTSPLPKGTYTLKLLRANFDQDIAALSLDIPFVVLGEGAQEPQQSLLSKLFFDTNTAYGKFEGHSGSIRVREKPQAGNFTPYTYFYPNYPAGDFTAYNNLIINPSAEYEVQMRLSNNEQSTFVVDDVVMTGKELLENRKDNPLRISEDLQHLKVVNSSERSNLQMELRNVDQMGDTIHTYSNSGAGFNIYLPNATYVGSFILFDEKNNVSIVPLEEFTIEQDEEIVFNDELFTKYTIMADKKNQSIFGFQTTEGHSFLFSPDRIFNSVSYPQNMKGSIQLYVADKEQYSTLWGYRVVLPEGDYGAEKQFSFSNQIQGKIHDVRVESVPNGYMIRPIYSLMAGELNVRTIYQAVEGDRLSALGENEPIRDYIGLFNSWNQVSATISLIDEAGKVIWKSEETSGYGQNHYLQSVEPGTYTIQIHIPTSSGKSIKLTETVVLDADGSPFIQLTTPKYGTVTDEESVTVAGSTNQNATVMLELHKDGTVIDNVEVVANDKGSFSYNFNELDEGSYKVIAKSAGKIAETAFTIDRTPPDAVAKISLEDKRVNGGLLQIGSKLKVLMEGSYEAGFKATATVVVDGAEKEIALTYNEESKSYEGEFLVEEGMKLVESITGFITDGTGKTDELTQEYKWAVGSTVQGSVNDGNAVGHATVRLISSRTYSAETDASGNFKVKGLPAGTYKVTVSIGGKSYAKESIVVGDAVIMNPLNLEIPATSNAVFSLVDKGTESAIKDGLNLRLTGPNGFIAYGTSVNGKFKTYDGKTEFANLQAGEYRLTVYGQGAYLTTNSTINLNQDLNDYLVEVEKLDVIEKDITISLPNDVDEVSSISLQSYTTYKQHQYSGIGNYYFYNIKKDMNGNIVLKNVAIAEDYELHIDTEGYMSFNQQVDLTKTQNFAVELEKGRVISGIVTDSQGNPVPNIDVYAYSENSYRSAKTDMDGKYELIGLPKTAAIQVNIYSQIYLAYNDTIKAGTENAELDIQLAKSASITGKVVDRNGSPLSGVSVSASSPNSYGWGRTADDGTFTITGLVDTKVYDLTFTSYGYPSVTVEGRDAGDVGTVYLQAEGDGDFEGAGNFLAAAKSAVVPAEEVQFTLSYRNNGSTEAKNVPVHIQLPNGLSLISNSTTLNGKGVDISSDTIIIPTIKAGESGKITFTGKVADDIADPSLTTTAQITENGSIISVNTSVVFVTLEAPAQTGTSKLKVYGNAKYGSNVEVYANNQLVGQTKVDGKWWFMDIKLPVKSSTNAQDFTLSAKVTDGDISTMSKPVSVKFVPDVPTIKDVTVYAGWNGDVKLNPYTGIATFAITEHTPLHTEIVFDKEVDSAKITFLGKEYDLKKGQDNKFTFDGNRLGRWTSYGEQLLQVTFKKGDMEVTLPLMNIIVLIDPSGFVFEGSMENPLEGVQAVVETKVGDNWVQWDAEKYGQVNPQVTDEAGRYGWDVITGEWRVIFTKDGYEPYISRVMNVPPPETELNIPMVRITDPAVTTATVSENDMTVKFDRFMKVGKQTVQLFEAGSDVPVEGMVQAQSLAGYKSISTPADKQAGFIGKDSKGEDGFFSVDSDTNVASTFTFIPAVALKANTTYQLVVSGEAEDYAGKLLGESTIFEFTTSGDPNGGTVVTKMEELIDQLDEYSPQFEQELIGANAMYKDLSDEAKLLVTNSGKLTQMNELFTKRDELQTTYNMYKSWKPHLTDKNVLKPWTITFSADVDSKKTDIPVYVYDRYGRKVEGVKAEVNADKIVLTPSTPYRKDHVYYIVVSKDIKSATGATLKEGVLATFTIE
ncbi:carboxypeptidase regulatory-like domain-containing protein [Sporosarcina sp. SAFN-015]|uniref:carboxypeptidase regulatory-like domain-containing protein n=1 Tax=Sporosarcina sp. SAFN-015 TaxID=3387274 RepID=UPI003F809F62